MVDIVENLKEVHGKIDRAYDRAKEAHNENGEVMLCTVTKTRSISEIREAVDAGEIHLGENKVQEIIDKFEHFNGVNFHMIGHLQTNKVKYIIDKVFLIHSLDSIKLAKEIDKRAKQHGITANVLVQVNISNEESKYGLSPDEVDEFIESVTADYDNILVKGLMSMAPIVEKSEDAREYFEKTKKMFDNYRQKYPQFEYLSMGMSGDYEVAIECGANIVRVGTSIFGPRSY